eukprot:scaffold175552_cov17-Tisochrysis_lutea.AAC.1
MQHGGEVQTICEIKQTERYQSRAYSCPLIEETVCELEALPAQMAMRPHLYCITAATGLTM